MNGRPREPIMTALKEHLIDSLPGFKTISRRLRTGASMAKCDCPALFIDELSETCVQGTTAVPEITTMTVLLWIVVKNPSDENYEPIIALNTILDQIDAAFAAPPYQTVCTLNGLVNRAWIEGVIEKDAGELAGLGMARVPLKIVVP